MMSMENTLSPARVCEILSISKSTLLRLERDEEIPAADRASSGERRYGGKQLEAIVGRKFAHASNSENVLALDEWTEKLALCKFLQGNETGLTELEERPRLSERTLKEMLSRALQLSPSDDQFAKIVRLVCSQVTLHQQHA
jgi:DNA-binding transcriptional MerR regulator